MPVAAKALCLLCILGFAVANILGYASHGRSPWLFLALMVALGLATVPVIGIEAISYTPYLAMLSALELPAPAWKWAVGVLGGRCRCCRCSASTASRPTSSSCSGRSCSAA